MDAGASSAQIPASAADPPRPRDRGGSAREADVAPGAPENAGPMTATTRIHVAPPPAPAVPQRRFEPKTLLTIGTGIAAVSLAIALVGLDVDPRSIQGAPAWLKPMKFGVSITLYLVTLRWMLSYIQGHRRLLLVTTGVMVATLVGEIVLIDLQVVRGTTSHFNKSTDFDSTVFNAMGGLVSMLFVATVIAAVLVLRRRGLDAGIAAGMRWGLLVSLLGMAEAALMIVNVGWDAGGGHTVGAPDGGPGLPITDWSTLHGDLRIGHFVGLHALQVLPILAWLLASRTGLDERTRARLLRVAAVGYVGLIALVTWQALRGQALLQPDAATLAAGTALVLLVGASGGLLLARRQPAAVAR